MYITLTYKFDGKRYDYEVSLSHQIVYDWFKHLIGDFTFSTWEKERQKGFERCFDLIWQEDIFSVDYFVENDFFLMWLQDREQDKAREEYDNQL